MRGDRKEAPDGAPAGSGAQLVLHDRGRPPVADLQLDRLPAAKMIHERPESDGNRAVSFLPDRQPSRRRRNATALNCTPCCESRSERCRCPPPIRLRRLAERDVAGAQAAAGGWRARTGPAASSVDHGRRVRALNGTSASIRNSATRAEADISPAAMFAELARETPPRRGSSIFSPPPPRARRG